MQFISNGPDIPDALLRAHEEGRVVFFCGAGVSYPSGLPGFKGLVEEIYRLNGASLSDIEREVFERGQFDATLDLLERRLRGQRLAVRSKLAQALKPKLRRKGATDTQTALLRLSRSRDGALRLVTTNFDRTFHVAAKRTGQAFQSYAAPMLPIPKNSRWDGLVFLHGLLPEKIDETALNRLVVTSGDFGLAYLTERWAARFVSELFRNYVVCFVGYSINDPVLRYMMDALAADRMLGEVTPLAWALADFEPGQEERKTIEWKAKGVTPILYRVPVGSNDHSALHLTLHSWADTYRDGVQGKEAIVVKHARTQPQDSTQQDDFVGRVLWALSDKSGLPAKRFADFNPAPSLDWLIKAFSNTCFAHVDLSRFEVPPGSNEDEKLCFSLIQRPAPYSRAPHMLLASGGVATSQWDDVMSHLARWLTRHLNDPQLILWIASQGGKIHDQWQWLIENELERFAKLQNDGKTSELEEIRSQAPMAIPGPLLSPLWRLLLSGCIKSSWSNLDIYRWGGRLEREGLTTSLRLELRELLAPKVRLKKPLRLHDDSSNGAPSRIKQLVDWEIVLAADHVNSSLRDITEKCWRSALPHLIEDFQLLLGDALDLFNELGEADNHSDRSHWDLPSITPHWQNRGFRDWVSLIELLRDSWLAVWADDSARATRIARNWFEFPYPTFKRLAFFAASQNDCIPPDQWVDWLLTEGAKWLWAIETKREVLRLLVLQGSRLTSDAQERLESTILSGPPREMYRDNLEEDQWQEILSRSVWLHLSKLNTSVSSLGSSADARLTELSEANSHWKLAPNERDEFSRWMSGTGDPDFEGSRNVDIAPRNREALRQWLTKPAPKQDPFYEDTWRDVSRTRFFHSLFALCDLAKDDVWPVERWRDALQVWAEEGMALRSWHYGATLVQKMPDSVALEIVHSLTWWLETVSNSIKSHENILLDLCRRILTLQIDADTKMTRDGESIQEPVVEAINHPIGHVAQALTNLWFKRNPNDNDLLPTDLKPIFTSLCDVRATQFRHARVLMAAQLIAFFRVDRAWTEKCLLPLFSWDNPAEAKGAWEGFMWSPRLYPPLLIAIKPQFLECVNHYTELGEHRQQFASFLTYAALGPTDGYSIEEFRSAFEALPREGLEESARTFSQALEGAADQREDYWKNRALPFWQHIWPKSGDLATPEISESLSRLIIAAGNEFPKAVAAVVDWLLPFQHLHYVIDLLYKADLCRQFPREALQLLNAIVKDQQWIPRELKFCLQQIEKAAPNLVRDPRYVRLNECSQRRGI